MLQRLAKGQSCSGVPEPRRLVAAAGKNGLAVRAERGNVNGTLVLQGFADRPTAAASHSQAVLLPRAVVRTVLPSGLNTADKTGLVMFEGLPDRLSGGGIPEPRSPIKAPGEDGLAVGAERDGADPTPMYHGLTDGRSGGGVPKSRSRVGTAGEHGLAVRTERYGMDRCLMHHRLDGRLRGRRIPDPRSVIRAASEDGLAVGAERHSIDRP